MKAYGAGKGFWDAAVVMTEASARIHDPALITSPYDNNPLDVTIFISCYNEEEFIVGTLDTVIGALSELNLKFEIIVVDDGSKDRSVELVTQYVRAHPGQHILLRVNACNKGLAQNYFDVAFIGRGKYYRLICGDNAEPKETIQTVFRELGTAEILVPYYASAEGKSAYRLLISRTYTGLINLITGRKFHYYNGLAVHLRYNVMRWHPNTRGFGFQADILTLLLDLGFSYKEIAVKTIERRGGAGNAITFKNLLSVMHTIADIIIRQLSNRVYKVRK